MNVAARILRFATLSLAFFGVAHAQNGAKPYIVIPDSWITADGSRPGDAPPSNGQAYIFPSVADGLAATDSVEIPGFFTSSNHFKGPQPKDWPGRNNKRVTLTVARKADPKDPSNDTGIISFTPKEIRSLDFNELRHLQKSFKGWLCIKGTSWFFQNCDVAYGDLDSKLLAFWRNERVLPTFATFARNHLNAPDINAPLPKAPTDPLYDPEVQYLQSVGPSGAQMFMREIDPGMQVQIVWGNQNFNGQHGFQESYGRITSGGESRLTISQDSSKHLHLFPQGTPLFLAQPQTSSYHTDLVYPGNNKAIFTTNHGMTVYNEFDLHHQELLTVSILRPCPDPRCPKTARENPGHLFLLSPYTYTKPDLDGNPVQFENEAVPSDVSVGNPVKSDFLSYQFVIIACGSKRGGNYKDDVEAEWKNLLKIATTGQDSVITEACAGYKQAFFGMKAFVHLRIHYSINGQPVQDGAPDFETVGQVLAANFSTRKDKTSSSPLLEVWRSGSLTTALSADRKRILFYTTNSAVLDQLAVREGDEIYVRSIPEALR